MKVGIVGIGKMGKGVATRLIKGGHEVVAFNRTFEKAAALTGATAVHTLEELVAALPAPRVVWMYLPFKVTKEPAEELIALLEPGDTLVDGGNSNPWASNRFSQLCAEKGIEWADVGTSGGTGGEENGYCLMIGTSPKTFERLQPLWQAVAQPEGYAHVGRAFTGHYVKMVHNAIEYGMMQAFAEGMSLLENANAGGDEIDLQAVTQVWKHGSIISSRIGDWVAEAYEHPELLEQASSSVEENGMARWAVLDGTSQGVPTPVIAASLFARQTSQGKADKSSRLLNAVRHLFGGHSL